MAGKLNPQIKTVEVGVRSLKEVTLYLIVQVAKQFMNLDSLTSKNADDVVFIEHILDLIKNNAEKIFALIADEGELSMDDLTNDQLVEVATIIYEVNYKSASKKLTGLFKKLRAPKKRLNSTEIPGSQSNEQSSISSETQEELTD